MAINRRNILLGLGAIVGGGGALIGTGAFSSVSAARSVTANTTGDGSAYLEIESSSNYVVDDTGTNELEISLTAEGNNTASSGFNDDAITTLNNVLTITNNAAADSSGSAPTIDVGFSTTTPTAGDSPPSTPTSGKATVTLDDGNGKEARVTFYLDTAVGSSTTPAVPLTAGESATVNVEIDTTGNTDFSGTEDELTIIAVSQ
ncbi:MULTISPECIES: hypothetical protein [Haloferax]|uniref:DUF1102 domain-containing protein n=2 Tax=Haloferax TaxID=2251 RepID=A0A6G1Z0S3_9EURY|nr:MULTISPECIES: hypothetical protein [Haloferax]KAB1187474.1 hypothetical protein Hfx1149_05290 [Haloferax sp. CBA1149]MRW80126.1 hypothetical protein [Haloferax marinisediminis]